MTVAMVCIFVVSLAGLVHAINVNNGRAMAIFGLALVGIIVGRIIYVQSPWAVAAKQAEHAASVERVVTSLCKDKSYWDAAIPRSVSGRRGDISEAAIAEMRSHANAKLEQYRQENQWTKPCA